MTSTWSCRDPSVNVASKATPTSAAERLPARRHLRPHPKTRGGAAAAPVDSRRLGHAQGQVVFDGAPPSAKVLEAQGKAEKDPDICAVNADIKSRALVVDDATKGVKNVLVYLPRPTAVNEDAKKAFAAKTVEFDQKNCVFEPHVLALMTGVNGHAQVERSRQPQHQRQAQEFDVQPDRRQQERRSPSRPARPSERPAPVVCDIHPWMTSWWMVLDNPYFAVTDDKGNFEIKNVPAGTQKVVVWQEIGQGRRIRDAILG